MIEIRCEAVEDVEEYRPGLVQSYRDWFTVSFSQYDILKSI